MQKKTVGLQRWTDTLMSPWTQPILQMHMGISCRKLGRGLVDFQKTQSGCLLFKVMAHALNYPPITKY